MKKSPESTQSKFALVFNGILTNILWQYSTLHPMFQGYASRRVFISQQFTKWWSQRQLTHLIAPSTTAVSQKQKWWVIRRQVQLPSVGVSWSRKIVIQSWWNVIIYQRRLKWSSERQVFVFWWEQHSSNCVTGFNGYKLTTTKEHLRLPSNPDIGWIFTSVPEYAHTSQTMTEEEIRTYFLVSAPVEIA